MSTKEYILLTTTIFLAACSGGSSVVGNEKTCRNFVSSSMTDGGVTQTCSFDQTSFILSCNSDSGSSFDIEYASIEDFVLESKTLGLLKATSRTDGPVQTNYVYEADQLKSVNLDFSAVFGSGSYLSVTHNEFDSSNRPISGTSASNLGSGCSGNTVSIEYSQDERIVSSTVLPAGSCLYLLDQESMFDQDGNLVETTLAGATTKYTIQTTDEVCF